LRYKAEIEISKLHIEIAEEITKTSAALENAA